MLCFRCFMIGYFFRDCTVGTIDLTNDATPSAVAETMYTTITADSPVKDRILRLIFTKLIN